MGKSSPPAPPDPKETSQAQTGTNVATAIANNTMQMADQSTPYGDLTYTRTGTESFTDPYTGQTYDIPTYASEITLSPEEQAIYDANSGARTNLAQTGEAQSAFLRDYLANPFDGNTAAIEGRLDELYSSRMDPKFAQDEEALRTRLANQGVTAGSEAWNREIDRFNQAKNDARIQTMLQGRGQAFNELAAIRNQPINEITALLSGSQVNNPNVAPAQPGGIPTTDNAGLIMDEYDARLSNWQTKQAQRQSLLGGLFGLGANIISAPAGSIAAGWSDRRLKRNIVKIGEHNGLGVYEFDYVWGGPRAVGFMADEVEAANPAAVLEIDGFKAVDYGALL